MSAAAHIGLHAARGPHPPAPADTSVDNARLEAASSPSDMQTLMLSVAQVCRLLGIGRTTLWAMVRDGELGSVKCGARVLFPRPIVEEYVQTQAARAREAAVQRQRLQRRRGSRRHTQGTRPPGGQRTIS